MVRRGSIWCGVAQHGAAWLNGAAWRNMVLRGSIMERRCSIWCGVAQLIARWLAVRQGRVRFSFRLGTTGRFFPLSLQAMRIWREAPANGDGWMCLNECMYVCYKNMKNKQKEWHPATKPLISYKRVFTRLLPIPFSKLIKGRRSRSIPLLQKRGISDHVIQYSIESWRPKQGLQTTVY